MKEKQQFLKVPDEVMYFISQALSDVIRKKVKPGLKHILITALKEVNQHPYPPKNGIVISFRYNDLSFAIVYLPYKIELSEYVSDDSGFGYDHYERYNFKCTLDGSVEEEGLFYEFENEFESALKEIGVENIGISLEE
jgi:hypothetical protein